MRVQLQHSSMLFSSSDRQHNSDVRKVFGLGSDIITGTEAGPGAGNLTEALHRIGEKEGYRVHLPGKQDSWIAVSKDFMDRRRFTAKGLIPVTKGARESGDPHRYGPKGLPWVTFENPIIGEVTVGAGHWLTKGRWKGQAQRDRPGDPVDHFHENTLMGRAVGKWAKDKGAGPAIVFYGADVNIVDKAADVFRGQPLTTCWDELKKWPNTGHGNIDILASYDRDRRVKWKRARALDDKELHLFSDHFTIVAEAQVRARKS